jgi:hypothetical protein
MERLGKEAVMTRLSFLVLALLSATFFAHSQASETSQVARRSAAAKQQPASETKRDSTQDLYTVGIAAGDPLHLGVCRLCLRLAGHARSMAPARGSRYGAAPSAANIRKRSIMA